MKTKRYAKYIITNRFNKKTNEYKLGRRYVGQTDDLQGAIENNKKYPYLYGYLIIDKETNQIVYEQEPIKK